MVRIGKFGEYEKKTLEDNRIYLTWHGLQVNLARVASREALLELMRTRSPDQSDGTLRNHAVQIWAFSHRMKSGDWVVIPSKAKAAIHVAEIAGSYTYQPEADDPYRHHRSVKWIAKDVPRSTFDQDLLYSFGAIMTICEVKRNDAERRVRALATSGWARATVPPTPGPSDAADDESHEVGDLEVFATDQIASRIIQRFKGHGLERLVEGVLKAQGFATYHSPAGPDKGIDILAAPGPLGFGRPRICVQVKSSEAPVDSPTLNQLIGAMQNVQADQGLLVAWGGFKSSVEKEVAAQFFRVRLWDQKALIEQLLASYDQLDEDLKAELPLKRIWALSVTEEDES